MASVEGDAGGSSTMTSLTSFWIKFFKDAGIPVSIAATYAVTFTDNRIQPDMLLDLTTELLSYMCIDVMGDIIAILKHAKKVHMEKARENVLKTAENSPKPTRRNVSLTTSAHSPSPSSTRRNVSLTTTTTTPSPSPSSSKTAARRIVERYIGNDSLCDKSTPDSAVHVSKEMSARLGPTPTQGDPKKSSSVFTRLGGTPQRSVEGSSVADSTPSQGASPVFGITVGAMRSAVRPPPEVAVPYAGVLKSPETLKRVREEEATFARKKLKDTKIVISNEAAVAVTRRKPILMDTVTVNRLVTSNVQPDSCSLHMDTEGKKSIKERIGATVVTVATTTTRVAKPKTSMAGSRKADMKSRLGQTPVVSSTRSVKVGRLRSETMEVSSSVDTKRKPKLTRTAIGTNKKSSVFNRLGTAKDV